MRGTGDWQRWLPCLQNRHSSGIERERRQIVGRLRGIPEMVTIVPPWGFSVLPMRNPMAVDSHSRSRQRLRAVITAFLHVWIDGMPCAVNRSITSGPTLGNRLHLNVGSETPEFL
jgi:hypothetical protein